MKKVQVPRGKILGANKPKDRNPAVADAVKTALQMKDSRKAQEQLTKKHISLNDLLEGGIPLRQIIQLGYNLKAKGFKAVNIIEILYVQLNVEAKKAVTREDLAKFLFKAGFKDPAEISDALDIVGLKIPEIRNGIKNLDYNATAIAKSLFQRGLTDVEVLDHLDAIGINKTEDRVKALFLNGIGSNRILKLLIERYKSPEPQIRKIIYNLKNPGKAKIAVPVRK